MNFSQITDFATTENLTIIASFVFFAGGIFVLFMQLRRLQYDPVRERLSDIAEASAQQGMFGEELTESLAGQLPVTRQDNGALDQELRRAGLYKPTARNDYLALRNVLIIMSLIMTGIAAVAVGPERPRIVLYIVLGGLGLAILCWALPRLYLRRKANQRVDRITAGLPDALDMMTMCLSGGMSLQNTLPHVSGEIFFAHPDLAIELLITEQQASILSLPEAFQQFANRIETPEIRSLASVFSEGQRLGTNLSDAVVDFADDLRLKRQQEADERAGTIGLKLVFPVVFLLLPAAVILLIGPAVTQLIDAFSGLEDLPEVLQ